MAMRGSPEIKRYIAPLLVRRSDLILAGRWLVLKPVGHYLRGVYFDRSRWRGSLIPIAMVLPLYQYPPERRIVAGHELRREKKCWDLREVGGEAELCEALEVRALPIVANVNTPDAFLSHLKTLRNWLALTLGTALVHAIKGEFDKAEPLLLELFTKLCRKDIDHWDSPLEPYLRLLVGKLRQRPADLIGILHEWEAGQVKLMKLEKYWQPSPFPCEIAGPA